MRLEIRMGVGRILEPPSLVSPPGFSLCFSPNLRRDPRYIESGNRYTLYATFENPVRMAPQVVYATVLGEHHYAHKTGRAADRVPTSDAP